MPDQCRHGLALVVAAGSQFQFAQESSVFGDDTHVVAGDQEQDRLAALLVADVKVTETAEVAKGDATAAVEPVAANAVIDLRLGQRRRGFESGIESLQRRASVESSMRSLLVVDGPEGIELELQMRNRFGGGLLSEEELEGLVEAFDLAAG